MQTNSITPEGSQQRTNGVNTGTGYRASRSATLGRGVGRRVDGDAVRGVSFFAKVMTATHEGEGPHDPCDLFTKHLRAYTGALCCGFALYNENNGLGYIRSLASKQASLRMTAEPVGGDVIGMRIPFTPELLSLIGTPTVVRVNGLHHLSQGALSREQAENLEKAFNVGECYLFPLRHHQQLLAIGCIILPMDKSLSPGQQATITTVARLFAISLHHYLLEEAYNKTVARLHDSEERYRQLFEQAGAAILVMDGTRIIDANSLIVDLFGFRAEELIGQDLLELLAKIRPGRPELPGLARGKIEQALAGQPQTFEMNFSWFNQASVTVEVRLLPVQFRTGTLVQAIMRDITHLRHMENEIGSVEKFRLLGELAATISHEVRNPLMTVRGFLQYFLAENHYPPQDQEYFRLMISELDSATTIISDFLDMARPTGPRRQTLSLSQLLASLVRVMASKAIVQKVEMLQQIADGITVAGDPTQVREVFVNIIQNAFQAMPDGGRLAISLEQQGDEALITISDTGCGIPEEALERLGRPFFTTKPGGTGLGLSACYRIINNHHGRIAVASEVGRGTTFTIVLPTL